jgi:hypothetical protein
MDNKMVKHNHEQDSISSELSLTDQKVNKSTTANPNVADEKVNIELLNSIKNFMDDLATVTTNKNFINFKTIVTRIDETKIKSYLKLVDGFKKFYEKNSESLTEGDFGGLNDPNISYVTDNGSFTFDFQQTFQDAEEVDQDIIKDHLNHIWNILNNENKSPEEVYIDKIFRDLKSRFSPELNREEQMTIAKNLFSDFQKQDLDISIVVKAACKKARTLLLSNGSEDHSKTLVLIDAVEEIDVNNFNMVHFMGLVAKVGTLFSDGESNPLNGLLSSIFADNAMIPIDDLKLDERTLPDDS